MSEVFEGESYDPNMQASLGDSLRSLFQKAKLIGKAATWGGVSAVPGVLPVGIAGFMASRLFKQHQSKQKRKSKAAEFAKERQETRS